MSKLKKTTLYVKGMHCPSCEVLITDKFKELPNVKTVNPNFKKQEAEIYFTGQLDQDSVNKKIKPFGYEISEKNNLEKAKEPLGRNIFESLLIAVGLGLIYLIAKELDIVPSVNITGNLNLLTVFLLGLVASISTCMATSGALFLSTLSGNHNKSESFTKALAFSSGRIISYAVFGFVAGLIGSVIIENFKFGSILTLLAAVFMILLSLDMLKIASFASFVPFGWTTNIYRKMEHSFIKDPHKSAFILGSLTYLLPCGFTQATQVYALGLASPWQSALTMAVFAVGTAPAILFIGSLSGFLKSDFYKYFMKIVAVGVFILGLYYVSNFLAMNGVNFTNESKRSNKYYEPNLISGKQIINMDVVTSGYVPSYFTVKKGIPVRWIVNGKNVFGCQGYLVVQSLNISKALSEGENVFEFTPKETGFINFSCGMGMYRGRIEVI